MTENIGKKLTELISPLVSINLSEAETESYPFAVYDYTPEPVYSKDGIHKVRASASIYVVSDSFDEADDIVDSISEALSDMGEGFSCSIMSISSDCTEGVWTIDMEITVNQYR